jgi:hypothetical protein
MPLRLYVGSAGAGPDSEHHPPSSTNGEPRPDLTPVRHRRRLSAVRSLIIRIRISITVRVTGRGPEASPAASGRPPACRADVR